MELNYSDILIFFSEITYHNKIEDLSIIDKLWEDYSDIMSKTSKESLILKNIDIVQHKIIEKEKNISLKLSFRYFSSLPLEKLPQELGRFQIELNQIREALSKLEISTSLYDIVIKSIECIEKEVIDKFTPFIENRRYSIEPIKWLGTQKELGELFIELKKKGFIDEIQYKTIQACFTKSDTINQVLKPEISKATYQPTYPQIYTERYISKFDQIKEK